ncbi:Fe-S cluster assembly sulfur transfer protein SufU [Georgenia alba]|uniref:Fe-S cluster assembly sulfur transfer protein SufU n=1 Tax=Georgenia alba TaxID=2233858 RepID=A0ABW2QBV6_9MICO
MAEAIEQLYQQVILDHSRERHGVGEIDPFDGESFQVNPTCGDEVRLRVRLDHAADRSPVLSEVGWVGQGCSISQASLSILHDLVTGRSVTEVEELGERFRELMRARGALEEDQQDTLEDAAAFVGVARYPARIKCALLGWMALRDALAHALTAEPKETDS